MFFVVTLLAVTVVSAGAVVGPQIGSLTEAVHGEAGFEISLTGLDTRTLLYDRDDNEIFRFVDDGSNRELLTLQDMPDQLITSVVTIEDAEFFTHPGINLRATVSRFLSRMWVQVASHRAVRLFHSNWSRTVCLLKPNEPNGRFRSRSVRPCCRGAWKMT